MNALKSFWQPRSTPRFLQSLVAETRKRERSFTHLSDSEFERTAAALRDDAEPLVDGKHDDNEFCRRLAVGAQAVHRTHGFKLHDVQLLAILTCATGNSVEMQTGEGKTLVAGITAYVRALDGQGVHVATTNEYLAARDHEQLAETYRMLGVSSAVLVGQFELRQRREAYKADITYGPGYQFGFDYLHDQLTLRNANPNGLGQTLLREINGIDLQTQLCQYRGHSFTAVDEADSVLIDEAATPLVIGAGPVEENDVQPYLLAVAIAGTMQPGIDYDLPENGMRLELTQSAQKQLHDDLLRSPRRMQLVRPWPQYVANALRAKHLFHVNEHYVVVAGEIQIVDPFTGRIHPDRNWQGGLHQAVEAKEGVEVVLRPSSIARITRQRYYSRYGGMSGMSGTISGVAQEVKQVYGMRTVTVPTHRPCCRQLLTPRFFASWESKLKAIADDCVRRNATGQPILIGTRTIRESQRVQSALQSAGLDAVVLNGVQDQDEANIIGAAGNFGAITIATNMAGRGTDIKPCQRALAVGGLHVIATEPNTSERVDRQLIGRTARQGNPGSAQFFVGAEDDLIVNHDPKLKRRLVAACHAQGESKRDFSAAVLRIQSKVEQQARKTRESLVAAEKWMDGVRELVVKE